MMDPDQKYISFVRRWAEKRGDRFEIDNFDWREKLIDGMAVADVWGGLLPEGTQEKTDENYGCVEWKEETGRLELKFEKYE